MRRLRIFWGFGSSPRLWGVSRIRHKLGRHKRFIPTPVGSIHPLYTIRPPCPVHPHACGEYGIIPLITGNANGSSPRLWGVLHSARPGATIFRFIPTPVGSINKIKGLSQDMSVHPHACGEYPYISVEQHNTRGSSPRLWGVFSLDEWVFVYYRFIPTPVGSIVARDSQSCAFSVHPHACGEYSDTELQGPIWSGSSPRLWGVCLCCLPPPG